MIKEKTTNSSLMNSLINSLTGSPNPLFDWFIDWITHTNTHNRINLTSNYLFIRTTTYAFRFSRESIELPQFLTYSTAPSISWTTISMTETFSKRITISACNQSTQPHTHGMTNRHVFVEAIFDMLFKNTIMIHIINKSNRENWQIHQILFQNYPRLNSTGLTDPTYFISDSLQYLGTTIVGWHKWNNLLLRPQLIRTQNQLQLL